MGPADKTIECTGVESSIHTWIYVSRYFVQFYYIHDACTVYLYLMISFFLSVKWFIKKENIQTFVLT